MIKLFKKKEHLNPDTGDVLSRGEYISWQIQGVIRNWWFAIIWSVGTFAWWIWPKVFLDTNAYIHWMNLASWLAVTVELVIGIAMFGQTKRDAMIIREIKKLEKQDAVIDQALAQSIQEIKEILARNGMK